MVTNKLLAAGFGVFSGLVLAMGSANAADVASTIFINELNQWSDNSGEQLGVDDGDGVLEIGETLRGTFDIQTIEDITGPGGTTQYGTGGVNELSGIFEIVVTSVNVTNDPDGSFGGGVLNGDETVDYSFGAYAPFQVEFGLSGTTMVVFFDDPAADYSRTGTIANAETTATGGTKVLEIGFTGDVDESWQSEDTPSNVAGIDNATPGIAVGEFSFGLGILVNSLFGGVTQVGATCLPVCPGDGLVDINGSGSILGTGGLTSEYDAFNNVDLTFQPTSIPEPGSLGMLGAGLVGLGFFLRTRRQKQAA